MRRDNMPGKPNPILYALAFILLYIFFKLFWNLRIDKSGFMRKRGPYLVIANHISNIDFLIAGMSVFPRRLHYLAARLYFRNPALRLIMNTMGCIPKEQFIPDVQSIKDMINLSRSGRSIILYPAGQSSFTGEATYIDPSIAKLVRKLDLPVVTVLIEGAHMALPKFNMKKFRRSRIEMKVTSLLGKDEIHKMTDAELYEAITDAIYFDDYEW